MPMDEDRRRAPAGFKKIEDIDDGDIRVSVIGTLVDSTESKLVVDDGTGKIEASFDLSKDLSSFEEGNIVRIIGRPSNGALEGEVAQDFSGFDTELYEEVLQKIEGFRD